MNRIAASVCLCAGLLLVGGAEAQTIRGTVIGDADGRPITQAHVAVLAARFDSVIVSRLSYAGEFLFDLPEPGSYRLRVTALGYTTLTTTMVAVPAATVVTVEVRLRADAIPLEPLRVVAERPEPPFMQDVRRRRAIGFGRLITREQLDERLGSRLEDVLRDTGLWITDVGRPGEPAIPLVTARLRGTMSGVCYADLYLNGVRQFGREQHRAISLPRVQDLFQFRPDDIEAIEIYRGAAEVPAEYSGSTAQCGVVAFWLRSGYGGKADPGGPYTGPPPRVTLRLSGARQRFVGRHAPERGTSGEAAAYWRLLHSAAIGVRLRQGRYVLPAATTEELMRGTNAEAPGPRNVSIVTFGVEPRLVSPDHWRVRPFIGAGIQVARRQFDVPVPGIPGRRSQFTSHASGWGGTLGVELPLVGRMSLEGAVRHERLRFGAYEVLETRSKATASEWRATAVHFGLSTRL